MPRTVTLTEALETTALGYGCANLFRDPSGKNRLRLLEHAYEVGIRHFDVAPMYGLGVAERELGRFARGRRDRIVIATKFGILPTRVARSLARVQAPVRTLFSIIPSLRGQAKSRAAGPSSGPVGAALYASSGYNHASAKASLEMSIRELGTDYVDLFLLHDPAPAEVDAEEIFAYLEEASDRGHIRAWGIAGEPAPTFAVADSLPGRVPVLQLRDDVFERSQRPIRTSTAAGRITFGVLARPLAHLVTMMNAEPERRRRWNAAVGADCGEPETLAWLLLRDALRNNPSGTVLFGSIQPERIASAARAATVPPEEPDAALDAFRRLVDTELRDVIQTAEVDP